MYSPVYPHDPIKELFPGIFILHGSIKMGPGMRMNRNMIILQNGSELTLVNPVRMSESGLQSLEKLGNVKNMIRLGDFHGADDKFYLDKYRCDFWAQSEQTTYKLPIPMIEINSNTLGPIPESEFFIFERSKYPEAALFIKNHKLLITTDSIQYYSDWSYFSGFTKFVFKLLGFKIGLNIGGPWLKRVTPKGGSIESDFIKLMSLDFDSLVAAHGSLLKSGAKNLLNQELAKVFKQANNKINVD